MFFILCLSDGHNTTSWIDHCISSVMADHLVSHIEILQTFVISDYRPLLVQLQIHCNGSHNQQNTDDNLHWHDPNHINWNALLLNLQKELSINTA